MDVFFFYLALARDGRRVEYDGGDDEDQGPAGLFAVGTEQRRQTVDGADQPDDGIDGVLVGGKFPIAEHLDGNAGIDVRQ